MENKQDERLRRRYLRVVTAFGLSDIAVAAAAGFSEPTARRARLGVLPTQRRTRSALLEFLNNAESDTALSDHARKRDRLLGFVDFAVRHLERKNLGAVEEALLDMRRLIGGDQ